MKLFAYCRVSTGKQAKHNTIENQRRAIRNHLRKSDHEIIQWFEDDGVSAFKYRPAFEDMMGKIGEVDGVIIAKLSRIGRSVKDLLKTVDVLRENEKKLIVVGDYVDTSTAAGRMFLVILSAVMEYEAELISERTTEGRERAKAEDMENGVNRFGRKKVELTSAQIKRMVQLYTTGGLGVQSIAKVMSTDDMKISYSTVRRRLIDQGVTMRSISL